MIFTITWANAESMPTFLLSRKALYLKVLFLNQIKVSDQQSAILLQVAPR